MNDETQQNGHDNEDAELKALVAEQEGELANEAATVSLQALGLLGAMTGPVTLAYRMEVAKSLIRVLLALASVRYCIESATEAMNDGQRMAFIARFVGIIFSLDPEPIIAELIAESIPA